VFIKFCSWNIWWRIINQVLTNVIEYITIASTGNAVDFGDLSLQSRRNDVDLVHHQLVVFLVVDLSTSNNF
jgi:hypothetical protein